MPDDGERGVADSALRLSEERFRLLVESVTDYAIFMLDPEGRVASWNSGAQRIKGYQAEEILGQDYEVFFPPEDRARGRPQQILDTVRREGHFQEEGWRIRVDSTRFWADVTIRALYNPDGSLRGFAKVTRDATARMQAEQQRLERAWEQEALAQELAHHAGLAMENARLYSSLLESEARYRTLIDLSPDGIVLCDAEGRILLVNGRAATVFGYGTPGEMENLQLSELIAPQESGDHRLGLESLLASDEPRRIERRIVRRDGTERLLEINATGVRDQDGRARALLGVCRDVTDQRALEGKIQQAQKLESLGVLAGGIAHDFNNLLMGIMGHASLALMKLPRESAARPSVEQIQTAAERAAELTNQMLAYSGKGKFVVRALDLAQLVEEMAHLLQVSISKKAVLKYDFAANLPAVEGDATQLRQVVMNLITNAADAIGDRSGMITVATGALDADAAYLRETYLDQELQPGQYVYVEVSDTGVGMDAETRARIFEPFFTTKFTGRGLGLAAVLGIVRGHHGALQVYSEPDKGTTFKVLFPAAGDSAPPPAFPAEPASVKGTGVVLVVDDDETVRSVARQMLEAFGYQVMTASDGREAVDTFKARPDAVDVVLLDMTMPRLNGEETFRELRRLRPDVRVILSSGYNEQDATNRFAGKGLAGFIQKPYRPHQLIERIREALGTS